MIFTLNGLCSKKNCSLYKKWAIVFGELKFLYFYCYCNFSEVYNSCNALLAVSEICTAKCFLVIFDVKGHPWMMACTGKQDFGDSHLVLERWHVHGRARWSVGSDDTKTVASLADLFSGIHGRPTCSSPSSSLHRQCLSKSLHRRCMSNIGAQPSRLQRSRDQLITATWPYACSFRRGDQPHTSNCCFLCLSPFNCSHVLASATASTSIAAHEPATLIFNRLIQSARVLILNKVPGLFSFSIFTCR